MAFPATRLRRLRRTDTLRALVRETSLSLDDVVMPLFACPGEGVVRPVDGLGAIAQRSVDEIEVPVYDDTIEGGAAVLRPSTPVDEIVAEFLTSAAASRENVVLGLAG